MAKALVLGGETGLLGQALCPALAKNNWEVHTLGRNNGDIFNPDYLRSQITRLSPDAIFNTIAWTQVDDAELHKDKADEINRLFPLHLARILKNTPDIWLCHFSTDFVFSEKTNIAFKEMDPPSPASVYGSTKLEGEKAVLSTLPDGACIIRTAWLFGPGRKNFVANILNLAKEKDTLKIVDDQTGSPTYTCDLAEWTVALANARATGIWNGVNSGVASWYELAKEAVELAGLECRLQPVSSSEWPQKATRPSFSVLDNHKLSEFLGKPPRPWLQALRDYIFCSFETGQQEKK